MATNSGSLNISQPTMPIFGGENYDFWSIKMKTSFLSQDIWDLVENGFDDPPNDEQMEQNRDNKKKDAKALFFIQQSVSEAIFPRIIGATTAKEAWDLLKNEFSGNEKVKTIKLQSLRRDLENLHMKDAQSLKEYFSKVLEITNQMRSYGETISDKKIVEKILISLPAKYDSIVGVIEETKDLSTLTVSELMGSLEVHEQRTNRHTDKSIEHAFQTKLTTSFNGNYSAKGHDFRSSQNSKHYFEKGNDARTSQKV
ncbi:uncharacterized protein LOC143878809 [Tasmannia lanceolata]|uniref:uncharacterized protein LOC143878809 n=1 Tax=Tasmannia lanceolata TaxID=3420 RepID=UPI0040633A1C